MDASLPSPQPPPVVLPFVSITVLENGQFQTQTNLKDKSLMLGLLETAKFQIMLAPPDAPALHPPHDGFAQQMLRRIRG